MNPDSVNPNFKHEAPPTNKQIADTFRKCKPYLWGGSGRRAGRRLNICGAIGQAYGNGEISSPACSAAREVVMGRLDAHPTIARWLAGQGHITDSEMGAYFDYFMHGSYLERPTIVRQIQAYRHAWVDALINEFEGKPDGRA